MSSQIPPDPFFNNINFNPSFFIDNDPFLTQAMANFLYLKLTGGNITGNLGIGTATPQTNLDVNGKVIINDGSTGIPANGILGGLGTELILKVGTAGTAPTALGIDGNNLWMGTNSSGSLVFYTGTTERMRVKSDGYLGIGTTNPGSLLTINPIPTDVPAGQDFSISPVTITNTAPTGTSILNDPKPILYLCRNGTFSQTYASRASFSLCRYENSSTNSRTRLDISLSHTEFNEVNVMSFKSDGKVGIGTTNPQSLLTVNPVPTDVPAGQDFSISPVTITNTAPTGTSILNDPKPILYLCRNGTLNQTFASRATFSLCRYENSSTNSRTRLDLGLSNDQFNDVNVMSIRSDGRVGIGTTNPGNILQVASGERLKISNNNSDLTQIGTSETTGLNNTRITISGSSRSTNAGCIEYTAVNNHIFYSTVDGAYDTTLDIDPYEFKIYKSCTTYGANYFTEGQFLSYQTRVNSSGQSKSGYFYSTEWWAGSFINLAISHTTPTYTYWHGHIGTNNSTSILYSTAFSVSNMNIESFVEQGVTYLYMYPTIGYTTSVQMRIKFYG